MRDRTYLVDINKKMYETPYYKQYDNDIPFRIRIVENGVNADLTGYTIKAFFNNKTEIIQKNCTIKESIVETKLDNNILKNAGEVDVEFCLTKKEMIVTTFTITIKVEKSINRNEAVEKEPTWDIIKDFQTTLDNAINKAKEDIKNTIDKAEADIENAMNTVDKLEQDVATAIASIDGKINGGLDGKLDKTGGTMTGKITTSHVTGTYLAGNQGQAIINSNTSAGTYVMLYRYPSTNGYFTMGGYQGNFLLQYTAKSTVDASTNSVTKALTLLNESGNTRFPGTVTAPTFTGALSGNATTATTLQTARTINGTSFNGSANITTANWGIARTITIGNTGKSVNGAGNVSWSLADIGASPSNHNHDTDYLKKTAKAESAKNADTVGGKSFVWEYGSDNPTHIWGTNEGATIQKVWNPNDITVGFAKLTNGLNLGKAPRVSNLNNITSTGFYAFSDGATNAPCNYGTIIHIQWNADTATQLVQNVTGTGTFWIRSKNGTWSAWRGI
ncbi:MAG: BppU family phage baseplate upper protein [Clostridium sp.]|nr:BppU family phage baseplate upper protein [Clostridium sp.]